MPRADDLVVAAPEDAESANGEGAAAAAGTVAFVAAPAESTDELDDIFDGLAVHHVCGNRRSETVSCERKDARTEGRVETHLRLKRVGEEESV